MGDILASQTHRLTLIVYLSVHSRHGDYHCKCAWILHPRLHDCWLLKRSNLTISPSHRKLVTTNRKPSRPEPYLFIVRAIQIDQPSPVQHTCSHIAIAVINLLTYLTTARYGSQGSRYPPRHKRWGSSTTISPCSVSISSGSWCSMEPNKSYWVLKGYQPLHANCKARNTLTHSRKPSSIQIIRTVHVYTSCIFLFFLFFLKNPKTQKPKNGGGQDMTMVFR